MTTYERIANRTLDDFPTSGCISGFQTEQEWLLVSKVFYNWVKAGLAQYYQKPAKETAAERRISALSTVKAHFASEKEAVRFIEIAPHFRCANANEK